MSILSSHAEQRAKKAEDYPSIFGSLNLTGIRENVGEILKVIGRNGIFREYTLHDANHIDAMLALVDKLIPSETAARMRTADWLMIVLSCYFHDLGMLVTKKEFESRDSCPEFLNLKGELLAGEKGKDYQRSSGEAVASRAGRVPLQGIRSQIPLQSESSIGFRGKTLSSMARRRRPLRLSTRSWADLNKSSGTISQKSA